jgi:hypothetical protein
MSSRTESWDISSTPGRSTPAKASPAPVARPNRCAAAYAGSYSRAAAPSIARELSGNLRNASGCLPGPFFDRPADGPAASWHCRHDPGAWVESQKECVRAAVRGRALLDGRRRITGTGCAAGIASCAGSRGAAGTAGPVDAAGVWQVGVPGGLRRSCAAHAAPALVSDPRGVARSWDHCGAGSAGRQPGIVNRVLRPAMHSRDLC